MENMILVNVFFKQFLFLQPFNVEFKIYNVLNWTYYIRLDKKLRDLKLHKLTLNHEKKKQKLRHII